MIAAGFDRTISAWEVSQFGNPEDVYFNSEHLGSLHTGGSVLEAGSSFDVTSASQGSTYAMVPQSGGAHRLVKW